jgi:cytochrome bd-type quinol oxidase subunit 1
MTFICPIAFHGILLFFGNIILGASFVFLIASFLFYRHRRKKHWFKYAFKLSLIIFLIGATYSGVLYYQYVKADKEYKKHVDPIDSDTHPVSLSL